MEHAHELLTSSEVGRILDKSIRTVQRMTESGELPCVRKLPGPNGPRLYDRADVEAVAERLCERRAS